MLSNRDQRLIIIVIREDDYNRVIVKPTISKTIAINTVQINDNVADRKQSPKCNLYND